MRIKRIIIYAVPFLGLLGIALVTVFFVLSDSAVGPASRLDVDGLLIICDENVRYPVEAPDIRHEAGVVGRFSRRHGIRIEVNSGPAGELVASFMLEPEGDIFLAGDACYIEELREAGHVQITREVARLVPVILVRTGNPLGINGIPDLADPDIRLAVAGGSGSLIRSMTAEIFSKNGLSLYEPGNVRFTGDSMSLAARAVDLDMADAAVVWRPLSLQYARNTEVVEIPAEYNVISTVTAAVLNTSSRIDDAVRFAEYLTGRASLEVFEMYGFDVGGWPNASPQ